MTRVDPMNDTNTSTGGPGRAEAEASHERFLATIHANPDRSKATVYNYGRALWHLLAVAPVPPDKLNDDHIAAFRGRLDQSISRKSGEPIMPTTVNVAITGVRAYLKWARRHDLLGHPGLNTRRDRRDHKRMRRERTLTSEEDIALMTGCHRVGSTSEDPIDVRNHAFVLFLLTTGLRIGEALDLRWRDLDLETGTVHVWSGKGGKERTALMDPRAAEVMGRLRDLGQMRPGGMVDHIQGFEAWGGDTHRSFGEGDPVFCGSRPLEQMPKCNANNIAKKISKRYTGKEYTAHCFRHTFCTRFLRHGKTLQDLQTLMELAGHSSMDTTQGYLDLDEKIRDERFDRVIEAHWSTAGVDEAELEVEKEAEEEKEVEEEEADDEQDGEPSKEVETFDDDGPSLETGVAVDRAPTLFDWS
jgi:integrase